MAPGVQPGTTVAGTQWVLDHVIGSGSFATVWRAHLAGDEAQVAAIKVIPTDRLSAKLRQSLECEVDILRRTEHANVVKLHEVVEERDRLFLVMEFCGGGDLAGYLRRHRRVPEPAARAFLQQLAAGLRELWRRHFVHRDLKPQNLLLAAAPDGGEARLVIGDFGFARGLQPQRLADTLCGSPLYMAPEILQFHKYDAKADLWSVGVILFELLAGKPPFDGGNHVQLLRNIERGDARPPAWLAAQLSRPCAALLGGLLQRNPVERISFEEFFSHPFITGEEPPPAPPPPAPRPQQQQRQQRPHRPALGAAASASGSSGSGEEQLQFSAEALELPPGRRLAKAPSAPAHALAAAARRPPPGAAGYFAGFAGLKAAGRGGGGQPGGSSVLADSLEDEDDYVIIERAPSAPAAAQDRARAAQSASAVGLRLPVPPPPPPLTVPLVVPQPTAAADSSLARIRFTAGLPRGESLRRVALLLEDLATGKQAGGEPAPALALRLLSLQVIGVALELGAAAPDAHAHARLIADRAQAAGAALQPAEGGGGALPNAWDVLYGCALGLAQSAAVDELLGSRLEAVRGYARAGALFYFLLEEGPQLALQPRLRLQPADARRLLRFTASVALRHQGCAALLAPDAAAGPLPASPRPPPLPHASAAV